jgi:hypothetical protein
MQCLWLELTTTTLTGINFFFQLEKNLKEEKAGRVKVDQELDSIKVGRIIMTLSSD